MPGQGVKWFAAAMCMTPGLFAQIAEHAAAAMCMMPAVFTHITEHAAREPGSAVSARMHAPVITYGQLQCQSHPNDSLDNSAHPVEQAASCPVLYWPHMHEASSMSLIPELR